MGIEALFDAILEARRKNNPKFSASGARDVIVDEMRRAMDQLKEAAVNVVMALPFLNHITSIKVGDSYCKQLGRDMVGKFLLPNWLGLKKLRGISFV